MNTLQDIVFVDVDDTIVRTVGSKRIPMPRVIEHIRQLHARGAVLYLWSSGGADYARASAIEFDLHDLFQGFLPKPRTYIDDQPIGDWRYLNHLYPTQVES
jgi:predicted HAD superfamily phosphohydrolase YqeG